MSRIKLANVRKLVVGGVASAAVALPLTMIAAPAQAATLAGCTVIPLAPVVVGVVGGQPNVQYRTRVTCAPDRIVQIRDNRREADAPAGVGNDFNYGTTTYLQTFDSQQTIIVRVNDVVTSTENSNEEAYHRTSFRVTTIGGVTAWTAFQNSSVLSVAN